MADEKYDEELMGRITTETYAVMRKHNASPATGIAAMSNVMVGALMSMEPEVRPHVIESISKALMGGVDILQQAKDKANASAQGAEGNKDPTRQ